MKKIVIPASMFFKDIYSLIKSPLFILLTIVGNGLIGLSGLIFYHLESQVNPKLTSYLDAIWWSFATATTTGFGDIVPITSAGKVLGIFVMVGGTALFAIFTALFAETFLLNRKTNRRE